jgi:hypothetical protein
LAWPPVVVTAVALNSVPVSAIAALAVMIA